MPLTRGQKMTEEELLALQADLAKKEKQLHEEYQKFENKKQHAEATINAEWNKIKANQSTFDVSNLAQQFELMKVELAKLNKTPVTPESQASTSKVNDKILNGNEGSIGVKEIIGSIPSFNGNDISVFHFTRACERAREMIPENQEFSLVQLLINKLKGHAFQLVQDLDIYTVDELTTQLKNTFAPQKTANQYRGEIGNLHQNPGETVLDYAARVKEIKAGLIDCLRQARGNVTSENKNEIETETLEGFVQGLMSQTRVNLKIDGYTDLNDAISKAVRISKNLELEKRRYAPRTENPRTRENNLIPRNAGQFNRPGLNPGASSFVPRQGTTPQSNTANYQPKICSYCGIKGHEESECRRRGYVDEAEPSTSQVNSETKYKPIHFVKEGLYQTRPFTRITIINLSEPFTRIRVVSKDLSMKVTLMIDTGSPINLIKNNCILHKENINSEEIIDLQGLGEGYFTTLGTITITLFGLPLFCHVVNNDFPIQENGIIGNEFFFANQANMDYEERHLKIKDIYVPFEEYQIVTIPKRSVTPFHFRIANPEIKEGYLPRQEPTLGVFTGDALVRNSKGRGYIRVHNVTNEDVELVIPNFTLQTFAFANTVFNDSISSKEEKNININSNPVSEGTALAYEDNKRPVHKEYAPMYEDDRKPGPSCEVYAPTCEDLINTNPVCKEYAPMHEDTNNKINSSTNKDSEVDGLNFLYSIKLSEPENTSGEGRAKQIIKTLKTKHLNVEERKHVTELITEFVNDELGGGTEHLNVKKAQHVVKLIQNFTNYLPHNKIKSISDKDNATQDYLINDKIPYAPSEITIPPEPPPHVL